MTGLKGVDRNLYWKKNMRIDKIMSGAKYRINENLKTWQFGPSNSKIANIEKV